MRRRRDDVEASLAWSEDTMYTHPQRAETRKKAKASAMRRGPDRTASKALFEIALR